MEEEDGRRKWKKKMIEAKKEKDLDKIVDIWLHSNLKAHHFIPKKYWYENLEAMKKIYIPKSKTYVYRQKEEVKAFISLINQNLIAALFVDVSCQNQSIGTQLIDFCKKQHTSLLLHVYCENKKSITFYKKCGFTIIKQQPTQLEGHSEYVMQWVCNDI